MINLNRLFIFFIPTTILGFSLLWWRKRNYIKPYKSEVKEELLVEKESGVTSQQEDDEAVDDEESNDYLFPEEDNIIDCQLVTKESYSRNSIDDVTVIITDSYKEDDHNEPTADELERVLSLRKPGSETNGQERVRHQSSCDADSAYVDDYSSDVSISSSDHIKSPCSNNTHDLLDTLDEQDGNCRDWYEPVFKSAEEDENLCWGSIPMPETEYNLEHILYSLSSSTTAEDNNLKDVTDARRKTKKFTLKKSPKKSKLKENSKIKKETTAVKQSPPKPKFPRNSKKKSDREGIEGPWRIENTPQVITVQTLDFEFPEELCGQLIGKAGKYVVEMKQRTGASVSIEPEMRRGKRIVSITGNSEQIKKAKNILNERFNKCLVPVPNEDLKTVISRLTMTTLSADTIPHCIVTAIVDVGHFFLQIFHEDVDKSIVELQQELAACYETPRKKYIYTEPPLIGEYCVGFIDYTWCRLKVIDIHPGNQITVSFVDYGGNVTVPLMALLKIRADFLVLPLQSIECFLSNVCHHKNEQHYSYSANKVFGQLVEGKALQTIKTGEIDGVSCVELSYFDGERGEVVCVNKELIKWGLVQALDASFLD